jgi:hypothetical protein
MSRVFWVACIVGLGIAAFAQHKIDAIVETPGIKFPDGTQTKAVDKTLLDTAINANTYRIVKNTWGVLRSLNEIGSTYPDWVVDEYKTSDLVDMSTTTAQYFGYYWGPRVIDDFGNGSDGSITVTVSITTQTFTSAGRAYPDFISYRVTNFVDTATLQTSTSAAHGIVAGDEVMVIALQGWNNGTTNTYDIGDVGNYEFRRVQSVTDGTITLSEVLHLNYTGTHVDFALWGATALARSNAAVVAVCRIPNYSNVTVSAGVNFGGHPWAACGMPDANQRLQTGILAWRDVGTSQINGTATVSFVGFRNFPNNWGGESMGGLPEIGGGNRGFLNPCLDNGARSGISTTRGGAGHAVAGDSTGEGGENFKGFAKGSATLSRLHLGGGATTAAVAPGDYEAGGGIMFISAQTLNVGAAGALHARAPKTDQYGTAAGGSILLNAKNITIGANDLISTKGGDGTTGGSPRGSAGRLAVYSDTPVGTQYYDSDGGATPPTQGSLFNGPSSATEYILQSDPISFMIRPTIGHAMVRVASYTTGTVSMQVTFDGSTYDTVPLTATDNVFSHDVYTGSWTVSSPGTTAIYRVVTTNTVAETHGVAVYGRE